MERRSNYHPRMTSFRLSVMLAVVLAAPVTSQTTADASRLRDEIRRYRETHDVQLLSEFRELLSIPNNARDSINIRRNAAHITAMLGARGISARLLESPGSPPAVYGELRTPGATRTIVLYAHYDGQPVDSTKWATPPFQPALLSALRETGGRPIAFPTTAGSVSGAYHIYARSASDDKAPIIAMLGALDALRAAGRMPSVNLKFFFEGEEEAGSEHLADMLRRHKQLLEADLWIIADGPVHQNRQHQIVFGARGVMGLELTTYGPSRALHSGHYGNWAPNPIVLMSQLLASMRTTDGHITIANFSDDVVPITDAERAAIARMPPVDSALKVELSLAHTEANDAPLFERIMLPSLNLRGFQAGSVGTLAANAIPTAAHASIDFRMVPNQTPARVRELVEAHVRAQGYHIVHAEPTVEERRTHAKIVKLDWESGYPALRTSMSLPVSRALVQAASLALGRMPLVVPTLGGSLDVHAIHDVTRAPVIFVPIANHDNNQHAANENLRLQNLWDGIELFGGLMAHLGNVWREDVP
jgi:acetylornithine deacetylase/succinyl-diaminopimelate desuccinylase-like protein